MNFRLNRIYHTVVPSFLKRWAIKFIPKEKQELIFQKARANEFKENISKVEEYWLRYRQLKKIRELCEFDSASVVLDVGCGISTVLHYVEGDRFGIDPIGDEYNKIYDYPDGISVGKGHGENIPFPDHHFDVVFSTNVIDHVDSPEAVFKEIYRVLKPHGKFVLTVELFPKKVIRDPAHPHSLTKTDVEVLINNAGFKILFEEESPWIGMRNYVNGFTMKNPQVEFIVVLKK